MAAYDQPGFTSRTPAAPDGFDARAFTAPGSAPPEPDDGLPVGAPVLTALHASSQLPGEDRVPVEAGDTTQGDPAASTVLHGGGEDYVSTGAGGGRARVDSSGRYDWQQSPGG